jgi:YVTN family beta-propeller protein
MKTWKAATAALVVGSATGVFAQTGFTNWETPHVSPIALTPSGQTMLAVNTADARLEVFSLASGMPRHTLSIPVGLDPVSVRARSESEVWVVNHISDSVSIVDLTTGCVRQTLLTGDEPSDVVFANGRAFVSLSQPNKVAVYDLNSLATGPTLLAIQGEEPRAMAVSADGTKVYVAIFESGNATGVVRVADVNNAAGPYGGTNPPPNSGTVFSPARPGEPGGAAEQQRAVDG